MADDQIGTVTVRQTFDAVMLARRPARVSAWVADVAGQAGKFFNEHGARAGGFFRGGANAGDVDAVSPQALFQVSAEGVITDCRVEVDADFNFLKENSIGQGLGLLVCVGVSGVGFVSRTIAGTIGFRVLSAVDCDSGVGAFAARFVGKRQSVEGFAEVGHALRLED